MKVYLGLLAIVAVLSIDPPVLPDKYELGFDERTSLGPLSGSTRGKIYLDSKGNREVITRENGHHDRYCATIYKLTNTPCNHYVVDSN